MWPLEVAAICAGAGPSSPGGPEPNKLGRPQVAGKPACDLRSPRTIRMSPDTRHLITRAASLQPEREDRADVAASREERAAAHRPAVATRLQGRGKDARSRCAVDANRASYAESSSCTAARRCRYCSNSALLRRRLRATVPRESGGQATGLVLVPHASLDSATADARIRGGAEELGVCAVLPAGLVVLW
jgi:hypothetical protein